MPDSTKASSMARPPRMQHNFKRVAILFAGGPAPGANAVISTAATAFLRNDIEVVGVKHGYSHLVEYRPRSAARRRPRLRDDQSQRCSAARAIRKASSSAPPAPTPAKNVSDPAHLNDAERVKPLKTVYEALRSIGVDALISIGGDDTLKTANKFKLYQEKLPPDAHAHPRRPPSQDDRQRLPRHRLYVRLFHRRRLSWRRSPQPDRRRRGQPRRIFSSSRWAAAPAGWPTASPSPARPAS